MPSLLDVQNLHVAAGSREILRGIDLRVQPGEIHCLMGRNGSGKSTLASTIMGHPSYEVSQGSIAYQGEDLEGLDPDERARRGIFLAFQSPVALPGVSVGSFVRQAVRACHEEAPGAREFRTLVRQELDRLDLDRSFQGRSVHEGFSGGEKKRLEILQLALLRPRLALLDEIDSGLDVDGLRLVADGIRRAVSEQGTAVLLITHYERILQLVQPHRVHILMEGRVVHSGGHELAREVDARGFEWIASGLQEAGAAS